MTFFTLREAAIDPAGRITADIDRHGRPILEDNCTARQCGSPPVLQLDVRPAPGHHRCIWGEAALFPCRSFPRAFEGIRNRSSYSARRRRWKAWACNACSPRPTRQPGSRQRVFAVLHVSSADRLFSGLIGPSRAGRCSLILHQSGWEVKKRRMLVFYIYMNISKL